MSAATTLKKEALPTQALLERVLGFPLPLSLHEDNSACISAVKHGYSPALRDLPRTHRIPLGSLHEMFYGVYPAPPDRCRCCGRPEASPPVPPGKLSLVKEPTETQKGDIFTKHLDNSKFENGLMLLRMHKTQQ